MTLDPVLQQLLDQVPAVPDGPIDYPAVRQMAEGLVGLLTPPASLAEVQDVEDLSIDAIGGPVPARIYRPIGETKGIMHYIHGGGWALGNLATVDYLARRLCAGTSMVIVTSTYRLAPENPFPAGYDDSLAAAQWVSNHRNELGSDGLPVVLAGDSAGSNLAAAIAIAMRGTGERPFDAQLLLYPAVDLRSGAEYPSRRANADPSLRADRLEEYVGYYAGGADRSDPRLSPLAAKDLTGLPPALIVVLSVDPLRDEAVAYADALRAAGNRVELIEFDNLTHGFPHLGALVPAAAVATDQVMEQLQAMLSQQTPQRAPS